MIQSAINVNEALRMQLSGSSLAEIAAKYGVTRERVRQKLKTSGTMHLPRKCIDCGDSTGRARLAVRCKSCLKRHLEDYKQEYDHVPCACGGLRHRRARQCMRCRAKLDDHVVLELTKIGYSPQAIADFFDCQRIGVYQCLRRHGAMTGRSTLERRAIQERARKVPIEAAVKFIRERGDA